MKTFLPPLLHSPGIKNRWHSYYVPLRLEQQYQFKWNCSFWTGEISFGSLGFFLCADCRLSSMSGVVQQQKLFYWKENKATMLNTGKSYKHFFLLPIFLAGKYQALLSIETKLSQFLFCYSVLFPGCCLNILMTVTVTLYCICSNTNTDKCCQKYKWVIKSKKVLYCNELGEVILAC